MWKTENLAFSVFVLKVMYLFLHFFKHLLQSRDSAQAPVGLGGLGPWERVHQDISVEEHSQQATEVTPEVLQTHADTENCVFTKQTQVIVMHMHRLKYLSLLPPRPPVSKFFTTSITQLIVISPGTSFSVPITFTPLLRVTHHHFIQHISWYCQHLRVCYRVFRYDYAVCILGNEYL